MSRSAQQLTGNHLTKKYTLTVSPGNIREYKPSSSWHFNAANNTAVGNVDPRPNLRDIFWIVRGNVAYPHEVQSIIFSPNSNRFIAKLKLIDLPND